MAKVENLLLFIVFVFGYYSTSEKYSLRYCQQPSSFAFSISASHFFLNKSQCLKKKMNLTQTSNILDQFLTQHSDRFWLGSQLQFPGAQLQFPDSQLQFPNYLHRQF